MQSCDQALLVVRDPATATAPIRETLTGLEGSLISEKDEAEWPGTTLMGHTARVYRYSLDDQSRNVLCTSVDGLYEWLSPNRPEDLCMLRSGVPRLTTVAHEREGNLDLSRAECDELRVANPGLTLYRGEIMPSGSEPYRLFGAFLDEDSLDSARSLDAALAKYVELASSEKVA
jgi:hypothetical protein